jgi:hypothetical protein
MTVLAMKMGMEQWWDNTDRGTWKYTEETLCLYHTVHHKSHMDKPGIDARPPRSQADFHLKLNPTSQKTLNLHYQDRSVNAVL